MNISKKKFCIFLMSFCLNTNIVFAESYTAENDSFFSPQNISNNSFFNNETKKLNSIFQNNSNYKSSILNATVTKSIILENNTQPENSAKEEIATETKPQEIDVSTIDALAKSATYGNSQTSEIRYVMTVTKIYPNITQKSNQTSKTEEIKILATSSSNQKRYTNIELSSINNTQNESITLTPIAPSVISRFAAYSEKFEFDTNYTNPTIIHELQLH